ncbi:uncharacterized protein [Pempheris klunzingeri]|uniref:uncharacterized protein n=1 Tax=Pempheris klunzingeri TaxID=3127111 RepID=UPI003980F332
MTSWKLGTLLFMLVFLSTIDLSKQGCRDYFEVDKWASNLTDVIYLVKTKDYKDTIECTVEKEYLEYETMSHILYQCYDRKTKVEHVSEKCDGDRMSTSIHFYLFMCLVAKDLNFSSAETACQLYSEKASTGLDQTTLPPPQPATTTVMQQLPTTTAATTTTTTALPLKATTLPPPTTVTQSAVNGSNGQSSAAMDVKTDTLTVTVLTMSLMLNGVLSVAFYLYVSHQRREGRRQPMNVSNEAPPGAQPLMEMEKTASLLNLQMGIKERPHIYHQEI